MSVKRAGENTITYLLQKIKLALAGKVDKSEGKGLSTNDYTTTEKNKLSSLSNYTLPTAGADTKGGIKVGAGLTMNGEILSATGGGTADSVDWSNVQNKPAIPVVPTISTNVENDAASDTKTASPKAVKTYVDSKVSAVYKPQGTLAFASLPSLGASVLGNVYNVSNAFVTTADFVEGAGVSHGAGTNVVVISPSTGIYKFDALAGTVDLSGYCLISDQIEIPNTDIDTVWNTVFGA